MTSVSNPARIARAQATAVVLGLTLAVAPLASALAPCHAGSSCSAACTATAAARTNAHDARLSPEDVQKVVDYVLDLVRTSKDGRLELDPDAIEKATGVRITKQNQGQIVPIVLAKLRATPEGQALFAAAQGNACVVPGAHSASGAACTAHGSSCASACAPGERSMSRCAEYGACSLSGDLSGATDETLEMYVREKGTDGQVYEDFALPSFAAMDLQGTSVPSESLIGQSTMLVFLAGHCSHSFDTLPILQKVQAEYAAQGVRVVGVYLNSGSVEDVGSWIHDYQPQYDVWVHESAALGDVIDSHLVPTYLFVDSKGQVREKLVGFKAQAEVEAHLSKWIAATGPVRDTRSGE